MNQDSVFKEYQVAAAVYLAGSAHCVLAGPWHPTQATPFYSQAGSSQAGPSDAQPWVSIFEWVAG